jgi:signal transduction histidine kinase
MTGSGRLTLRARLLVLLICVTAAFLLIMGAVTAAVLNKQLGRRFNADLVATAARNPKTLAGNSNGYLAAAIPLQTGQVVLFTPSHLGTEFQQALGQLSAAQLVRHRRKPPFLIVLADGTRLRAVERFVRTRALGVAGIPAGLAAIVVAQPVSVVSDQVRAVVVTELITGGGLILLLALGGRWLIGRGLAPLGQMASAARQITSRGDLAARMPDTDDSTEVGRLGGAINTMLDRIQHAFGARLRSEQKVRQFAADASHELRTPLTTIRGYAELYRQGALGPDQLPDAMRRIEQEAQRMSTLVAELLELARLDRTSSLDLAETDLAGLVRDAAADAKAVEPDRPIRAEAPDRLVATVDEARIRQVLANLLGNIREHTPKGTPVAVRLAQVQGGAVLEVADAGPGLSQQDAAQAFDRFYRGSARADADGQGLVAPAEHGPGGSGAPDRDGSGSGHPDGDGTGHGSGGGSGLGLSIVQAIAVAHGGQATLESWPGRGTRVRIWLPARLDGPSP